MESGQLGYGDERVVFDLANDFSMLFEVNHADVHGRAFSLRDVHRLGSLTVSEVAEFVRAVKTWHDAVIRRRAEDGTESTEDGA